MQHIDIINIKGKHPSGNVSFQINRINPINIGEVIWVISPEDMANIGSFFNTDGIIKLDHELQLESLTEELYMSKLDAVKENFEKIQQYEIPEDWIYETYLKELL